MAPPQRERFTLRCDEQRTARPEEAASAQRPSRRAPAGTAAPELTGIVGMLQERECGKRYGYEAVRVDAEERMSGRFVSVDRNTAYLLPPSVQDWLPENHLARFVVEIVEQLDLRQLTTAYRGLGGRALCPGAGGVRTEDGAAQSEARAYRPQARRAAAHGAATRATADRSSESHRRGLADHANLGWGL